MRLLLLLLAILIISPAQAVSYHAVFGEFDSGNHSSPDSACLTLGGMIYPDYYARPVTGVVGVVDEITSSACATDVSYAVVANVYWLADDCYQPTVDGLCTTAPIICEDGFPAVFGDYTSCDRPILNQCLDGSIIDSSISTCPVLCYDYDTCYQYAISQQSCDGATFFEFTYTDPENWSFSCTVIDDTSPDNSINGGNQDGNIYNDPLSPITPTVTELDVDSLSSAIDQALQNDFSNIERAVRDNTTSADENTNLTIEAINSLSTINQSGYTDLETAIRDGTLSAQTDAQSISTSIDGLGTQLSNLTTELANDGPCDPSLTNYYDCLNTPLNPFPDHVTAPATIDEVNNNFKTRLDNAPIVQAFTNISSIMSFQNSVCPLFSIDLPSPINANVSTTIHCDLYETISPFLSNLMIVIWTFTGFRIFASA